MGAEVPPVVAELLGFLRGEERLKTEGLFRRAAALSELRAAKERINKGFPPLSLHPPPLTVRLDEQGRACRRWWGRRSTWAPCSSRPSSASCRSPSSPSPSSPSSSPSSSRVPFPLPHI